MIWGLSPIYWKLLKNIENFELASYRIILSIIPMFFILGLTKVKACLQLTLSYPWQILIASGCMFTNIFLFVYAVNTGQILQASFGYFLSPLLSILMAAVVLKEKLNPIKYIALFITLISVLIRLSDFNSIPWVAFALAFAFSLYGLLKKFVPINVKQLTFIEMSVLLIPSFFILFTTQELTLLTNTSTSEQILLLAAGIPTILPFLLFNYGVQKIPLNIVGFFQYLSPSLQFLIAYWGYQEKIITAHWISYLFIWCACGMVALNNLQKGQHARK